MQLTPRQRLFLVNIRSVAAGRPGHRVACDPATWLGRPLTPADRVKAHRTYGQLERRGLVSRHAWCDGSSRRFKTAALSLTPAGEALAASLSAPIEPPATAPVGAVFTPANQSPVPTSATPPAPTSTVGEIDLSRQSDYERRQATAEAESWTTFTSEPAAVADPTSEPIAKAAYRSVFEMGESK